MEIYLIRHGEIAGDPHQEYRPPVEGCLSDAGCQQAQRLSGALSDIRFDAIYASPLGRAIQTAQPLAEKQGLKIGVLPWLIEWRPVAVLSSCDEANYEEMERRANGLRREKCWKTAAGEGTLEMAHRIIPGFLKMLEEHGVEPGHGGYLFQGEPHAERIALFGHGGSLGQLAAFLLGVPLAPHPPIAFALTGVAVFQLVQRADVWYPVLRLARPY
jgi:broad specificity phosphatase PhoE